jgi:hypothetical protein
VPHDVTLLRDIALGIVFAAILGHVARLLRQPLLLGYIAGGILLSSQMGFGLITNAESIELIAEIGRSTASGFSILAMTGTPRAMAWASRTSSGERTKDSAR